MWSSVIEENEVCRILDMGDYYVLEDKTRLHMPIVYRGFTEALINISVDFAQDEKGKLLPVRCYYPKSQFELDDVLRAYNTLSHKRSTSA